MIYMIDAHLINMEDFKFDGHKATLARDYAEEDERFSTSKNEDGNIDIYINKGDRPVHFMTIYEGDDGQSKGRITEKSLGVSKFEKEIIKEFENGEYELFDAFMAMQTEVGTNPYAQDSRKDPVSGYLQDFMTPFMSLNIPTNGILLPLRNSDAELKSKHFSEYDDKNWLTLSCGDEVGIPLSLRNFTDGEHTVASKEFSSALEYAMSKKGKDTEAGKLMMDILKYSARNIRERFSSRYEDTNLLDYQMPEMADKLLPNAYNDGPVDLSIKTRDEKGGRVELWTESTYARRLEEKVGGVEFL